MPYCPTCNTKYDESKSFCPRDGTKLEDDSEEVPSRVGQVLADRYRIKKLLGAGGMGEVYIAEHVYINKKVALKLLRPEITSNEEAVKRFQNEAKATSEIGHENIILIDDFGKLGDGSVYFTMELLEGEDLSHVMLREVIPAPRALGIIIQICRGLSAAHSNGVIHRDMKPENVFLTKDKNGQEVAKILDFGIAKVNDAGNDNLTKTGAVFGTPHYMSPEQAMGKHLDHRADIYSVGVIMYEIFTGTVPFKAESFIGILTKHVTEAAVPPRQAAPDRGINPDIEAVILKAMDKEPDNRYGSMDEMLEDLARVQTSVSAFHDVVRPMVPPPPPDSNSAGVGGWSRMSSAQPQPIPTPSQSAAHRTATGPNVSQSAINPATTPPPGMINPNTGALSTSQPSMAGVMPGAVPGQSQPYVPAVTGSPQLKKKSGAGFIVSLIAGLVIVLGGGGAGAWYFLLGPGSDKKDEASAEKKGSKEDKTEIAQKDDVDDMSGEVADDMSGGDDAGGMSGKAGPRKILLKSNPTGATLKVGGENVGKTPYEVEVPDTGKVSVYLALSGHELEIIRLGKSSPGEVLVEMKPRDFTGPIKRGGRAGSRTRGDQSGRHGKTRETKPDKDRQRPSRRTRPRRRPPRVREGGTLFDDDEPAHRPRPRPRPRQRKTRTPFDD